MAEVCAICGLPVDLCVCGEIGREKQRIRIRLETRKWGKASTVIDGLDSEASDLTKLAQDLKNFCACGGTAKNSQIMLQGDHREKIKNFLLKIGFSEENIEVQ